MESSEKGLEVIEQYEALKAIRRRPPAVLIGPVLAHPTKHALFDRAQPWIATEDLDQDGKEWRENSAARIHTMIHASNYDTEALAFVMHRMIAGTAGIYAELKDAKSLRDLALSHLYCRRP